MLGVFVVVVWFLCFVLFVFVLQWAILNERLIANQVLRASDCLCSALNKTSLLTTPRPEETLQKGVGRFSEARREMLCCTVFLMQHDYCNYKHTTVVATCMVHTQTHTHTGKHVRTQFSKLGRGITAKKKANKAPARKPGKLPHNLLFSLLFPPDPTLQFNPQLCSGTPMPSFPDPLFLLLRI